jgi:hypothetical protein
MHGLESRPLRFRPYPHNSAHFVNRPCIDADYEQQFAATSRGKARSAPSKGWLAAMPLKKGQNSMLTARVTFGLGGLLLVNVVLLAVQMTLGINYLPI